MKKIQFRRPFSKLHLLMVACSLVVACGANTPQANNDTSNSDNTRSIAPKSDVIQKPKNVKGITMISKVTYGSQCSGPGISVSKLKAGQSASLAKKAIDNTHGGVFIEFGNLPHPGHSYQVIEKKAKLVGDKLILPAIKRNPDPNRMYPQVVVNLCAFVMFEQTDLLDKVNAIDLVDANGKLLAQWPNGKSMPSYM